MSAEAPIHHSAPWDRDHVVVTAFVTVLCLMGGVVTGWATLEAPDVVHRVLAFFAFTACVGTPLFAWLFAPIGFTVEPGAVTIHRRVGTLRCEGVTDARLVDPANVRGAYRAFGSGGAFGTYGRFRSGTLGSFRLYARQEDGMIAFSSSLGTVVFAPSDPAAALRVLRARRNAT